MLERMPHLTFFSRGYWNQLGDEVYGSIGVAFRQFLADGARLPDRGRSVRRELYGELMHILDNGDYDRWVTLNRTNVESIKAVGGRFILPEHVKPLMAILDETFDSDA
jgi:hypothetical protein